MNGLGFSTSGNPLPNFSGMNYPSPGNTNTYDDYNGDWLRYLQDLANSGDSGALDKLLQWLMNERSNEIARNWTANREDTAYQRLVADMRAAGINPYALMAHGGSPIASASSGSSYSGSYVSSYQINKEKNSQNWLKILLSSIMPLIGGVIAAML